MFQTSSSSAGPMFDGRAGAAVTAFISEAEKVVAEQGVNQVRNELGIVLRHPTGRYEAGIQTTTMHGDAVVWDGGIVYGPWLEGTGSRNRTTRFKGYATFRRVTQRLQRQAAPIAAGVLRRYLGRMG